MSKGQSNELSERELEILRLISTGASNKEIAQALFISTNTVKVHLRNIFTKIGVASRTEAALYAIKLPENERSEDQPSQVGEFPGEPESPFELQPPLHQEQQIDKSFRDVQIGNFISSEETAQTRDLRKKVIIPQNINFWMAVVILFIVLIFVPVFYRLVNDKNTSLLETPVPTETISRWKELKTEGIRRNRQALAVFEQYIYAIGGEAGGKIINLASKYDEKANQWVPLTAKPTAVTDIQAAVVDGLVIVPGGRLEDGNITTTVEIYNPALDQWSSASSLPVPRSGYALVAWEGRVFLFGGWDGEDFSNRVFRYDLSADQWVEVTAMPTKRGFMGAAVSEGRIFVYGGWDGSNVLSINEVYQPSLENGIISPWEIAANMPEPRYEFGSAGIAFFAYAVGGSGVHGQTLSPVQYNIQEDRWVSFSMPSVDLGDSARMVALNTNLHVFGSNDNHLAYQAVKIVVIPLIAP